MSYSASPENSAREEFVVEPAGVIALVVTISKSSLSKRYAGSPSDPLLAT
jgi:hypothetical protein